MKSRLPEAAALEGERKRRYVREMFSAIAPRYDLLNRVLSLTIDQRWRREAVDRLAWERAPRGRYLDLCAGTLDLAAELRRRPGFAGDVVGADFSVPMLHVGKNKEPRVAAVGADALQLPFPDAAFHGAMVAFGIRNLADMDAGLAEMARVLRHGGAGACTQRQQSAHDQDSHRSRGPHTVPAAGHIHPGIRADKCQRLTRRATRGVPGRFPF